MTALTVRFGLCIVLNSASDFCDTSCLSWESHGCAWQDHGGTMFLRLGVSGRQAKDVHCGNWPSWYCFALVLMAIGWVSVPPTCMSTPCSSWGLSGPCLSLAVVNLYPYSPDEHPTSPKVCCEKVYHMLFIRCFEMTISQQKGGCGEEKKMNQGSPIQLMTDRGVFHFLSPPPHPNSFHSNLLRMRLIAYTDYNAIMRTPILRTPIGDHFVRRRGMGVRGTRAERGLVDHFITRRWKGKWWHSINDLPPHSIVTCLLLWVQVTMW